MKLILQLTGGQNWVPLGLCCKAPKVLELKQCSAGRWDCILDQLTEGPKASQAGFSLLLCRLGPRVLWQVQAYW